MEGMARARDVPVVELDAVCKTYGATEAVRGIDLRVEPGELMAILGPNGAGKTTAINLRLGLRRATSGEVRLFGLPPSDRRAQSRRGVMLQESGVPSVLSVRELVDLFRAYYPAPLGADVAIGLAGLAEQANKRVGQLSGGQRQRLFFALAVCGDPDALFLDEPTVAMDVASRRAFLATIRDFAAEGRTVVLTTHDLDEADELAQRVVVIDHGRVVADDTPARLKARVPGKRVRFRTDTSLEDGWSAGLPVRGLTVDGAEVRFLSNEPEDVLAALFAQGIRPHDLEVAGAKLEEAFLALTSPQGVLQ
ncbi:MAG: ABC transporter ATP-binding protein [Candidatus Limnocylindrales bacterium]